MVLVGAAGEVLLSRWSHFKSDRLRRVTDKIEARKNARIAQLEFGSRLVTPWTI
jgi:hypothetical protein